MNKRTVNAYKSVLEEIKALYPQFSPKVAITDYEKGLRRALRECFKNTKVLGCHFHYSQVCSKYVNEKYLNFYISFCISPPNSQCSKTLNYLIINFHEIIFHLKVLYCNIQNFIFNSKNDLFYYCTKICGSKMTNSAQLKVYMYVELLSISM